MFYLILVITDTYKIYKPIARAFVCMDTKQRVDSVYLDFSKAFDSVLHSKLLAKLKNYNFNAHTINWIYCFLSDTLAVRCYSSESNSVSVTSSVPQGSILRSLIYLLYVNYLPSVCSINYMLTMPKHSKLSAVHLIA